MRQQRYEELVRGNRGLVRRYLDKMTGLSRAQITRLIGQYLRGEEVKPKPYRRHRFPRRYRQEDIALLAALDEAHGTLSGPATRKFLERACYDFGDRQYQRRPRFRWRNYTDCGRVAPIASAGWLTSRHARRRYRLGRRRKPEPNGRPGYLRVDTVHQGDLDGIKGVYHINAVDEVVLSHSLTSPPLAVLLEDRSARRTTPARENRRKRSRPVADIIVLSLCGRFSLPVRVFSFWG